MAYAMPSRSTLHLRLDRHANGSTEQCTLESSTGERSMLRVLSVRQALSMTWDFAEANVFRRVIGELGLR